MKKTTPLQRQADKRFLSQITGLNLDQENSQNQTGVRKLLTKIKHLL